MQGSDLKERLRAEGRRDPLEKAPLYRIGAYLIIYCGNNEGCCFTVRDIRKVEKLGRPAFEYDTGSYGWRAENEICTEQHARMFP